MRSEFGYAAQGDSSFRSLNRSARLELTRVRETLEQWFARYPEAHRADLRGNIRSGKDWPFRSAAFELVLHEMLLRLGCDVEIHPTLDGSSRKPDFLVAPHDGAPFFMEAVMATNESQAQSQANSRLDGLWDEINRNLKSPDFSISVEIKGSPERQPSAKKVVRFLHQQLATADFDAIVTAEEQRDRERILRWPFPATDACTLVFSPMPKSPESRGQATDKPLCMWTSEGGSFNDFHAIRQSLERKASYYRPLPHPYVIAINAFGVAVKRCDILDALFGEEKTILTFDSHKTDLSPRSRRDWDGFWRSKTGPRNQHVAAVLVARQLTAYNLACSSPCLYTNPWGTDLPASTLAKFPRTAVSAGRLEFLDGSTWGDVLGLDERWPEDQRADA